MAQKDFTIHKRLKELLHYDPDTGLFTWLTDRGRAKQGDAAGNHVNGYLRVRIHRKDYLLHRLAWLYVHGAFPTHQIDHINGVKDDNRIDNLRDVNQSENVKNWWRLRNEQDQEVCQR